MGLIEWYVIFAGATAVTSWYGYLRPAVRKARSLNVENVFTKHYVTCSVVYLVLTMLAAPLVFIPLVSSRRSQAFAKGIEKSVLEAEQKQQ